MFKVEAAAFTKAVVAAGAHTSKDPDLPDLSLLMFSVTANDELLLTASNGFTIGVAFAPVLESDGELHEFALHIADANLVAKVAASTANEELTFELQRPAPNGKHPRLRVAEDGGLFPGKQVTVLARKDHGRNVLQLWHAIATRQRALKSIPRRTAMNPENIKKFNAAVSAYKEPLIYEFGDPQGTFLIRVGRHFIGMITPTDVAEAAEQYDGFRQEWKDRLPMPLRSVETGS